MINRLIVRIFTIFWLTFALVLMSALIVLKLDSRQITQLFDSEQYQSVILQQYVEAEPAADQTNDLTW